MENIFKKEINDFEDFGLKPGLLKALNSFPPILPSYAHIVGLTNFLQKKDLLIEGEDDSLKTSIYIIGILQVIDPECLNTQAIICLNNSTIASTIAWSIKSLSKFLNIKVNLLDETLENFGQIVLGRIDQIYLNLMNLKLKTENLKIFIADEIQSFQLPITKNMFYETFKILPSKIQICLFGKTFCKEIFKFSEFLMVDQEKISLKEEKDLNGVKQYYIEAKNDTEKIQIVLKFYLKNNSKRFLIYCNQDYTLEKLRDAFNEKNINVYVIKNVTGLSKNLEKNLFRKGAINILITNDFNLQIQEISSISVIINFDMPYLSKEYFERVGCWPHKPSKWKVLNIFYHSNNNYNQKFIESIEKIYKTHIQKVNSEMDEL